MSAEPHPKGVVGTHRGMVIAGIVEGYWQRPDETKEMLRTNDRDEQLLYTSDLGYLDADGTQVGKVLRRKLKQRGLARATTGSFSDKTSGAT